jgi:hypothetical protein
MRASTCSAFRLGIGLTSSAQIRRNAMASFKRLSILGAATVLVVAGVSVAFAQPAGKGRRGSPVYDVKTEMTIKGTVESVETVTGTSGGGRYASGGTHLVVKTEKDALEVHVGPTAYLTEKGIAFAKGDTVEILGSRVAIDETPVVIARQIKKGDNTWTLRDASGRPVWSGPRR